MERQIKFRGIDTMSGEMVYGNLVQQELTDGSITTAIVQTYATYDVKPETVGQYTGYKDDEGKEIFEGDIIRAQYEDCDAYTGWHGLREVTDEVVFEYGSFRLKNTYPFDIGRLWDMNNSKVNVIGNIHEKL